MWVDPVLGAVWLFLGAELSSSLKAAGGSLPTVAPQLLRSKDAVSWRGARCRADQCPVHWGEESCFHPCQPRHPSCHVPTGHIQHHLGSRSWRSLRWPWSWDGTAFQPGSHWTAYPLQPVALSSFGGLSGCPVATVIPATPCPWLALGMNASGCVSIGNLLPAGARACCSLFILSHGKHS